MGFTRDLLKQLKDDGKSIAVNSLDISSKVRKYTSKSFQRFSSRSYYFWRENKRPIPLEVVLKIMDDYKLEQIEISHFSINGGNRITPPDENKVFFYYFLGLILGDGCLMHQRKGEKRNTYGLQITFREKREAEEIKFLVRKLIGVTPSIYPGRGCFNLCLYSKPLVLILHKKYDIPIGLKYPSLKVPEIIKTSTKNQKKAFVKGVFDSDGNIYIYRGKKIVQLRQKSYHFLKQIKELFIELGINFREPYYDRANNSWVLWTSKKEVVDNFINELNDFNPKLP